MAIDTAWLVGSYHEGVAGMTATLNGEASIIVPEDQPGGVYLRHPVNALSLTDLLQAAMLGLPAPIAGAQVKVLVNRKVQISATGDFTITWSNALLRDLLGFNANLSGNNSYTATYVSPLLWSPGKPGSPTESPLGTLGRPVYDTRFSTSSDGTQVSTSSSHTQYVQTFSFPFVAVSRYQTPDALGGEYLVLRPRRNDLVEFEHGSGLLLREPPSDLPPAPVSVLVPQGGSTAQFGERADPETPEAFT